MRTNETATEARNTYRSLPYYGGGHEPGWMSGGFGQHRDSDAYERSNFEAAKETYREAGVEARVDSFNHWAVGWVDELVVPITTSSVAVLLDLFERISNYPLLDEDRAMEMEWEENHPGETECYATEDDCPCGRRDEEDDDV